MLSSKGYNILSSDNDKSKCPFDLFVHPTFPCFGDPILLSICKNDVHMFVESKEGTNHHASILDSDPNSEVDPLKELASLSCHKL